jgi:sigma-B regulation protein RsbU (phosphoserine phosphatase)
MNESLYGWVETEHFVSMFVAAIDLRTRRMTFARAGHPRPLLLHADGRISELAADGIMLGVDAQPAFEEHSLQLRPGDRLLLFTDGLPECRNPEEELFGTGRVRRFLLEHRQLSGQALVNALVDDARDFAGRGALGDDLTLVLLDATDPGEVAGSEPGEMRHAAPPGVRETGKGEVEQCPKT